MHSKLNNISSQNCQICAYALEFVLQYFLKIIIILKMILKKNKTFDKS